MSPKWFVKWVLAAATVPATITGLVFAGLVLNGAVGLWMSGVNKTEAQHSVIEARADAAKEKAYARYQFYLTCADTLYWVNFHRQDCPK